jgi:hypothetical protein
MGAEVTDFAFVVPANAGTHGYGAADGDNQQMQSNPWIPAFAGMTGGMW